MTTEGQRKVWERHQDLFRDRKNYSSMKLHRFLRDTYPPEKHREMYEKPDQIAEKLRRPPKKRNSTKRPLSGAQKNSLQRDLDMVAADLRENKAEIDRLKQEIHLAGPIIKAILRSGHFRDLISDQVREQLEEFADARP
jgi:hypothetical protein